MVQLRRSTAPSTTDTRAGGPSPDPRTATATRHATRAPLPNVTHTHRGPAPPPPSYAHDDDPHSRRPCLYRLPAPSLHSLSPHATPPVAMPGLGAHGAGRLLPSCGLSLARAATDETRQGQESTASARRDALRAQRLLGRRGDGRSHGLVGLLLVQRGALLGPCKLGGGMDGLVDCMGVREDQLGLQGGGSPT